MKAKKQAFKNWRTSGSEVDKEIYKEYRKTAKSSVTKAKDLAYEDMHDKLNTREGQTLIYKLANTRKRRAQDITDNIYVNDSRGNTLTEDGYIRNRWSGYYSGLLNETNPKEQWLSQSSQSHGRMNTKVIAPLFRTSPTNHIRIVCQSLA